MAILRGRQTYFLAVKARERLENTLEQYQSEGEPDNWRLDWVACVALLRAIGHVLHKEDGKHDDVSKAVIKNFWEKSGFKNEDIFKNFIERDRNNILKAMDFGVVLKPYTYSLEGDKNLSFEQKSERYGMFHGLLREDEDALDTINKALESWNKHLCIIENAINENSCTPYES